MTYKPLEGLLVVALEQAVAAPLASSRLADAGARVIKLERHEGDFARGYDNYAAGHSTYFTWLNRHKQSCRVDLAQQDDRALVHAMLAKADVFIQNLGPGATGRLGLGSEALRAAYPRLITCDISGYAPDTPDAKRKAYDLMIQAESGLAGITGTEASGASRIGISICDVTTGMTAHAQILEALYRRERTGEGSAISVSLFDVAAEAMNIPYIAARNGGPLARRVGLAHPSIAPYGAYEFADGTLLVAVQSEREWAQLCRDILDDAELANDPRFRSNSLRVTNRPAMEEIIHAVFATMPTAQAIERLERAKIAWGRVSTLEDLLAHSALTTVTATAGEDDVVMVAGPAVVDGHRHGGGKVPALGEHDEALRREFALTTA
ncbi:MAG: carnitine dehydratase [Sphingobium sp.]|nr:MAG: carnitine dehydratase [Sphingobium sp.]